EIHRWESRRVTGGPVERPGTGSLSASGPGAGHAAHLGGAGHQHQDGAGLLCADQRKAEPGQRHGIAAGGDALVGECESQLRLEASSGLTFFFQALEVSLAGGGFAFAFVAAAGTAASSSGPDTALGDLVPPLLLARGPDLLHAAVLALKGLIDV